jgi:hypothetical protein
MRSSEGLNRRKEFRILAFDSALADREFCESVESDDAASEDGVSPNVASILPGCEHGRVSAA